MLRKPSEIIIYGVTLEKILEDHKKWLYGEGGECANLRYANLRYANLSNANLRYANLRYANLSNANLSNANLSNADLRYANLRYANLSNANLSDANLSNANLSDANLRYANLSNANLSNANLRYANLRYANLSNANLRYANLSNAKITKIDINKVKYGYTTSFIALQCPEKGSFIGYKKANSKIVELLITEDAKRSSATSRKCRCSKAKVLDITDIEGNIHYSEVPSDRDKNFIYKVGEIVEVGDFDENRWNECSTGIHFFITRDEAVNY